MSGAVLPVADLSGALWLSATRAAAGAGVVGAVDAVFVRGAGVSGGDVSRCGGGASSAVAGSGCARGAGAMRSINTTSNSGAGGNGGGTRSSSQAMNAVDANATAAAARRNGNSGDDSSAYMHPARKTAGDARGAALAADWAGTSARRRAAAAAKRTRAARCAIRGPGARRRGPRRNAGDEERSREERARSSAPVGARRTERAREPRFAISLGRKRAVNRIRDARACEHRTGDAGGSLRARIGSRRR
ncbi:hypothetical protein J5226_18505 [Lysobacter sp. K5869]|uniref:hypothetical protein n=1 Tax=Lysobacter sp. K5869 TaxID=2820808 RepID=UPI001C061C5E|nr:hypothetical protein [Lysobacter sp. K5869]QWP75588.1 hypothetical protein J5226_18505 [Lysobacter sp. K5869]